MTPAALVLAGGASRRMGVDKAFMPFAGRPLIEHTIRCLRPQVSHLALNIAHEEEGSKAGRILRRLLQRLACRIVCRVARVRWSGF